MILGKKFKFFFDVYIMDDIENPFGNDDLNLSNDDGDADDDLVIPGRDDDEEEDWVPPTKVRLSRRRRRF